MTITTRGIFCGTFETRVYELFGNGGKGWLKIGEYADQYAAREAYRNEVVKNAYEGLAITHRKRVEEREIVETEVSTYQVTIELKADFEEAPELVHQYFKSRDDAMTACMAARQSELVRAAWVVDISKQRTVDAEPEA